MRKSCLFFIALVLLLGACNSNKVKIRGKVEKLEGMVKLLAEMPGQEGLIVLAEQNVVDGDIDLATEELQIPARVWIEIAGKRTLETVVDTKDQIWIQGKIQFPDQIEIKGSGLDLKYENVKKIFKSKYELEVDGVKRKIERIGKKKKKGIDDDVMIGVFYMQIDRLLRARIGYATKLIEANPTQEQSLLILTDELRDSVDLQKRVFKKMVIANKESNLYKNLAEKLQ